jgi:hypothetical protein
VDVPDGCNLAILDPEVLGHPQGAEARDVHVVDDAGVGLFSGE